MNITSLDLTADIIDTRDIIARIEELEASRDEYNEWHSDPTAWAKIEDGEPEELAALTAILDDLKGSGGDEQWRGDWYPVTLIADAYFAQYAEELAYETGAVSNSPAWPYSCIDWEQAARELQYDYTSVQIATFTYWYR